MFTGGKKPLKQRYSPSYESRKHMIGQGALQWSCLKARQLSRVISMHAGCWVLVLVLDAGCWVLVLGGPFSDAAAFEWPMLCK